MAISDKIKKKVFEDYCNKGLSHRELAKKYKISTFSTQKIVKEFSDENRRREEIQKTNQSLKTIQNATQFVQNFNQENFDPTEIFKSILEAQFKLPDKIERRNYTRNIYKVIDGEKVLHTVIEDTDEKVNGKDSSLIDLKLRSAKEILNLLTNNKNEPAETNVNLVVELD